MRGVYADACSLPEIIARRDDPKKSLPTMRLHLACMALFFFVLNLILKFETEWFEAGGVLLKNCAEEVQLRPMQEVGWLTGLEPATTGITILDSTN